MMKRIKTLGLVPVLLLTSCDFYNHYVYDSEGYTPLEGTMDIFSDVTKLDLSWVGGYISITQDIEDELTISETSTDFHLYYKVNDGCLSIKYVQSGLPMRVFNKLEKNISIRLPLSFESLKVDTVSSTISMGAVGVTTGSFNIIDGSLSAYYYFAKKTDIDCVNASLYFSPISFIENTDGSYNAHEVDIDAVQSDATVYYFRKHGYAVDFDGVKCRYTSELNNQKEYGDKLLKIKFDGVRSDLSMHEYYNDNENPEEGYY